MPPPGRLANVLLVDDDPEDLLALEASLASLGQRLALARDGAEALRFLLDEDAAVIVLDVQLRGMDGFELARALKRSRRTRHIPLIFLTDPLEDQRFVVQGYALGAVDYLQKPIEPEILRQKVAVFVELALKEAELACHAEALAAQNQVIEAIVANAPAGIAYLDEGLVCRAANAIVHDVVGGKPGSGVGLPARELFAGDPGLVAGLGAVLAGGQPYMRPGVVPGRPRPGGTAAAYEVSARTVPGPDGAPRGVLVFFQDVTDRVAREALQAGQIEALQRVDRLKDDFLSIVSHELRTPLQAILGFGSLLQDEVAGPLASSQAEYVEKMTRGAERLLALVNDLLDLSRIRAGRMELRLDRADAATLVHDVIEDLATLAARKHLRVVADVPGSLPATFDVPRLAQVLTNLLGNAIKFTPDGGTIEVHAHEEGPELVVEVADTGVGIAESDLPLLFHRFTQLDRADSRRKGGAGLGLSIAKALIEAHGGTIEVRSPGVGQGTTFRFAIPTHEDEEAPAGKPAGAKRPENG